MELRVGWEGEAFGARSAGRTPQSLLIVTSLQ